MAEEERGDFYIPPSLGDLTRGLAQERGELRHFDDPNRYVPPAQPGGNVAADLNRATDLIHQTETQKINPRPPPLLFEVISTYDSRPVQGYDFQKSGCNVIDWIADGGGSTFDEIFFDFVVPQNTVAVLRSFRYELINPPVNHVTEGFCWLQSDIYVNDLPVREYFQMLHPTIMAEPFPAFVVVDEQRTIRLRLSVFDPDNTEFFGDLVGEQTPVMNALYGNIILKTGVPIEFEIANPRGGQIA